MVTTLAADTAAALTVIDSARATARAVAWEHAAGDSPNHAATAWNPIVIDLDATLVNAHSEKEWAAPTYKRRFGFHLLLAFVDHGAVGTGEPVDALLRAGNAGSNTADDHIGVTRKALAQLPNAHTARPGRKVLVRTDGAGSSHKYLTWLHKRGVSYAHASGRDPQIGFGLTDAMVTALADAPDSAWSVAVDASEQVRDGARIIDAADILDLSTWPTGMRVIIRKERPHPGAQLRFTDSNDLRLTAFATNTAPGQVQDLEPRHRRRACCEDRIRTAKDTGLTNFPLHGFDQNRICLAIVQLELDPTAWTQMLGFTNQDARRWKPKHVRLLIFSLAGRIANHARRTHRRLSKTATWSTLIITAIAMLAEFPAPA